MNIVVDKNGKLYLETKDGGYREIYVDKKGEVKADSFKEYYIILEEEPE